MNRTCCLLLGLFLAACTQAIPPRTEATLLIHSTLPITRSALPEEDLITDLNLLIYDRTGLLEEKRYLSARSMTPERGAVELRTSLLRDLPYDVFVCANLGFELPVMTREELLEYRYPMTYPDEYARGMPMVAFREVVIRSDEEIRLPLQRAMARIDLRIDRSQMDTDIQFDVRSVRIGGCPSAVRLFGESKAEAEREVFRNGFCLDGTQVQPLNRDETVGMSFPVSLYLLENCQGNLLEGISSERSKVLTGSRFQEICSYIEIQASYHSPSWHTGPGASLVYRFYLGEGLENFDVHRNCLYRVTVQPRGDGLSEDSWRVDKSALEAHTRFDLHPAAYNEGSSGEDFHLWCDVLPAGTPLFIDPLSHDDDEGVAALYSYDIDPDGYGITLHPHKGGSALVYFRAGPPVNRDTLALVVFDP